MRVMVTCEHGGNAIPQPYQALFAPYAPLLAGHRGYDIGALALARDFAAAHGADISYSTTSRLLVDLNRSLGHPRLFSPVMRRVPPALRYAVLQRHYLPYRQTVGARVEQTVRRRRRLVHLSCHSFTPVLEGRLRHADVGLLFDPRHASEARFCAEWRRRLRAADPALRVWRNYPYRGFADALTAELRGRFDDGRYLGIQLEVNQKYAQGDPRAWRALRGRLVETFIGAVQAGC